MFKQISIFEMTNQELKAIGRKYQVLPNFEICCRELGGLKVTSCRACVYSFCSVCMQSRNVPFNAKYLQDRYHWEHDRHSYRK